MSSLESQYNASNSVLGLRASTRDKIWNVLAIGVGGIIGYSVIYPPVIGALIGGISGYIFRHILK